MKCDFKARMNKKTAISILIVLLSLSSFCGYGQDNDSIPGGDTASVKDCEQKDIKDFFRKKSKPEKPPRKVMMLILPNIGSNPAKGFYYGVGGSVGWYFGPKEKTKVSIIGFTLLYTTKKQFVTFSKSNIYTSRNKLFLQGDWRFYIYKAPTWGLGTNAPVDITPGECIVWQGNEVNEPEGIYEMSYNYIKLHEIVNSQIRESFYAGIGYHLDAYSKIVDESFNPDTGSLQLTPHYLYSMKYGFDPNRYSLSGVSLNFVYDSRDNMISPHKGFFADINYRYNPVFLGSDQNSSSLWIEFRTYVPISKKTPRHLIAFWTYGNFRVTGHQPYLTLMALGQDQKERSGRGYEAGRYRGENIVYGEVEYRFPITQCSKILGGVLFINATTASNNSTNVPLFAYVRPGVGFGLRFMINKYFRTNVTFDVGFGYRSKGFYFSGTETF